MSITNLAPGALVDNISDLKIIGVDENRPSKMQKQPYIDIVFKLSHQAPKVWCDSFNTIFKKYKYAVKIDENEGVHIVTWVRDMQEIPEHLKILQTRIKECNEQYIQNAN